MNTASLRKTLHQRIDVMPDFMVHRLATEMDIFASRIANDAESTDWTEEEWQSFVMKKFFRDEDDDHTIYTLNDAQEFYNR
jgi:hypothetical protein